jgi:hypothetical protein
VIVKPGTSAATMNGALARKKSLIITAAGIRGRFSEDPHQ